jgi:hypothetical protein
MVEAWWVAPNTLKAPNVPITSNQRGATGNP